MYPASQKGRPRSWPRDIDQRVKLADVACIVDRHYQTIHRWVSKGVVVRGERHFLKTERLGGSHFTTNRWFLEFMAAQQSHDEVRNEFVGEIHNSAKRALKRELA